MNAARILLINYEYPPLGGGAGTATAGMARALAAMGCDVVVLTSRFRGQPDIEQTDGFAIYRVPVLRRHLDRCSPPEMLTFVISASLAAQKLTRSWRPDLTIAFFGVPCGPIAWLLHRRFDVPYIVSLRGGDVPGFNWAPGTAIALYHKLTAPVIRFLWRRARAVVANGAGLQELAESALPGLRVPIVPNGVDAERITPRAAERAAAVPRLLLVGRLVHQKGADVLMRALGLLKQSRFTLEIVGDGPDRVMLQELAAREQIADRVQFTGWVKREQIADHYRAADVFVFPSRIEGMPNVVLEAMAYALPIIATAVPGNRELITHEKTGLLIDSENPQQLAAAVSRLLADAALRQRLGNAARAHVLEHHTWRASAAAYLQLGGIRLPAITAADRLPQMQEAR